MASEPVRILLLGAILSMALPVTFGHITTCRSPSLTSSAAIHFATFRPFFRRLAPFPLVLDRSLALVDLDTGSSWSCPGNTPSTLFPAPPRAACAPHQFSDYHALRQSRILRARHKFREHDPPHA